MFGASSLNRKIHCLDLFWTFCTAIQLHCCTVVQQLYNNSTINGTQHSLSGNIRTDISCCEERTTVSVADRSSRFALDDQTEASFVRRRHRGKQHIIFRRLHLRTIMTITTLDQIRPRYNTSICTLYILLLLLTMMMMTIAKAISGYDVIITLTIA